MVLITPKKCSQKQNKSKSDIAKWKKMISDTYWETADDYSAPTKGQKTQWSVLTKTTKDKAENITIPLKKTLGFAFFLNTRLCPLSLQFKKGIKLTFLEW